jgi:copper chaperone NosL
MNKKPIILMCLASVMLLGVFLFPLWKIRLEAPQYPDGVNMYIWVNKITGDTPSTLQNINILNHYIGMKYIEPDSIPELKYFPIVVIVMVALGLGLGFSGKRKYFIYWGILLMILGGLGIYDFYLWEYDYGHNLDPNAPIKIPGMVYQPPLIGSKMLLNFNAISWPHFGSLFLLLAIVFNTLSYTLTFKKKQS